MAQEQIEDLRRAGTTLLTDPLSAVASRRAARPDAPHPRISEILFGDRDRSFASIAALPSNVEAIEASLLFTTGVHRLMAIVGPSGWGKSHLLTAICSLISREKDAAVDRVPVLEYFTGPPRNEPPFLVLDDVQEVLSRTRCRNSLRVTLARRVRGARPTVLAFTAPRPSRQIRALLPNSREWTVVTIGEPAAAERVLVLNHMARQEGLAIPSRLVNILARQMQGDGRTYLGALRRLRAASGAWREPDETLRALGLLDPFFRDQPEWDLKAKILRIAEGFRTPPAVGSNVDLALYTMRCQAELAEDEVARAAGISPAEVYHRTNGFVRKVANSPSVAATVHEFADVVVRSLAGER